MAKQQTKKTTANNPFEFGKMPPQAMDMEEAVLGALMIEKDAAIEVLDILKAEYFYNEANRKIFQAISDLTTREKPIDLLTVSDELKSKEQLEEVGGILYITQLTAKVASAAHVEYHSRIVAQKYIQRELIRISSEIQEQSYDNTMDVDDLLNFSEASLFELAEGNVKKESQQINVIVREAMRQIEEASKMEGSVTGIPSGFTKLDRLTGGWQRSDLIIIAARPSMGKTAFVLSMARNMAVDHKAKVAVFSLEMSSVQLVNRLIASEAQIPSEKIRTGKLEPHEWKQLEHRIRNLEEAHLFIDDTPGISIFELRAKCRRLKRKFGIDVIIIDYLQLMSGPPETKGNREQEVSSISRQLKVIAKELSVPIFALSQLNRSVEVRGGDKRPQLSDLRESGAIEQDADIVMFIHRPEKYGFLEDDEGNTLIGMADIIVAKHRNGGLDDVRLRFQGEYVKFSDIDSVGLPLVSDFGDQTIQTLPSKMNEDVSFSANTLDNLPINNDFEPPPF